MASKKRVFTKREMALVYAGLIAGEYFDFAKFNALIIKQWSLSGLKNIKDEAWKIRKQLAGWEKSVEEIKKARG